MYLYKVRYVCIYLFICMNLREFSPNQTPNRLGASNIMSLTKLMEARQSGKSREQQNTFLGKHCILLEAYCGFS